MLNYQYYESPVNTSPLVMIHGFLCGGSFFQPNIQQISRHLPVITIDLPGFGNSSDVPAESTIEDMAKRVVETLDTHSVQDFYLLGHSMGGMVALAISLEINERVKKLIAYATHCDGRLLERFESFATSKVRLAKDFAAAKKSITATWFMQGDVHPRFADVMRCSEHVQLDTALKAIDAMSEFTSATDALHHIHQPALILAAEHDRTYTQKNIQRFRAHFPQADFYQIDGCAHNAHLEKPAEFNQTVLDFLTTTS